MLPWLLLLLLLLLFGCYLLLIKPVLSLPPTRQAHAEVVALLASAREEKSGLQATLAAIDDALQAMRMPSLLLSTSLGTASAIDGSVGSKTSFTPIGRVSSGTNGAHAKSAVAARVEQLCALYEEQRVALRVAQGNEEALKEELSKLRTKSTALSDEIAAHIVKESELERAAHTSAEEAASAKSRVTDLAAEVEAVHASAKAEAARRVEARSDELAMLEAEMSQSIQGMTLDHAADLASLQVELQAARACLYAEGSGPVATLLPCINEK